MTTEEREKLNKVKALMESGILLSTACLLLGYNEKEIRNLMFKDNPFKEIFGGN